MENLNAETIKKALECCGAVYTEPNNCSACPLDSKRNCRYLVHRLALALITSQEQRIKELTEEKERLREDNEIKSSKRANIFEIANAFERGRTDGVQEMQERLKTKMNDLSRMGGIFDTYYLVSKSFIDQIAKDMIGEIE